MAADSKEVRVGIIRCDTHGYWYAPLFETPNAELYRKNHWGCHYYFYRWDDPDRLRIPTIPGMRITRVFDEEDRKKAEGLSEAYEGRPKVCDSFEEVSDDVDLIYIADCNYEGKDHLRFAEPGLKKGVPHFVDKPFAYTLGDGRRMIELAKEYDTPIMCSSLLRQSPYLRRFRNRIEDIAPVSSVFVPGGMTALAGLYHWLSIVQNVMGEGCQWVESMGKEPNEVMRLHYDGPEGGTEVVLLNVSGNIPNRQTWAYMYHHCGTITSAYGEKGAVHSPRVDDYLFPDGGRTIVEMARRMALTRKPPIPYDSMLEILEIIEAGRLAHGRSKRVSLDEVRAMKW